MSISFNNSPWVGYITTATSNVYPMIITGTTTGRTSSTSTNISTNISTSGTTGVIDISAVLESMARDIGLSMKERVFRPQKGWKVETEDGTIIDIDSLGNISVCDKDARIIYKSNRIREFNRYLNASDLLEDFIRFAGKNGVRQGEVLQIPIEIFINWLIIEASKADGEEPPALPLENPLKRDYDRCLHCGRFISKQKAKLAKFCGASHYERYLESIEA